MGKFTEYQKQNQEINKVSRNKLVADTFRMASEKSLEAAIISDNPELISRKVQECKDAYEAFLDAMVSQFSTVVKISKLR